jgi:Zn-dependent protease
VGLLVLYRVCQPFTTMRKLVLGAMVVCVVGAFILLPPVPGMDYLEITRASSWLVLLAVLVMTPTVWMVINKLFDSVDALLEKIRSKRK